MIYIVMGVAGSGKTTVGTLLARHLDIPFYDADDFHPPGNVEKMRVGTPLSDEDRRPWLVAVTAELTEWGSSGGAVLACSALKESYRDLFFASGMDLRWIVLRGSLATISTRLQRRAEHFFPIDLLQTQLETLELPAYGWHYDVRSSPENIVTRILGDMQRKADIGILGLGVMGRNLALNFADRGCIVSGYNQHVPGVEENVAIDFVTAEKRHGHIIPSDNLEDCIGALNQPRIVLLMVSAQAVDAVLDDLIPLLLPGDVVIDAGNSQFEDSQRRTDSMHAKGLEFVGMGMSGGMEGARYGPALMPGGSRSGYQVCRNLLKRIAARDGDGNPCCAYIGPGGAGHFVKMVHNGIEYAEMQLIADCYHALRNYAQMSFPEVADVFKSWQDTGMDSYLLKITIDILNDENPVVDQIRDIASHKGTGVQCVQSAAELGVPADTIAAALSARQISSLDQLRREMAGARVVPAPQMTSTRKDFIALLFHAYVLGRCVNHATGFDILHAASEQYQWRLEYCEIAGIWTAGCIIRSSLMRKIVDHVHDPYRHLLAVSPFDAMVRSAAVDCARVISELSIAGLASPVLSAAYQYYLGLSTAISPAALIQAQRDHFGGHGIELKD